jgi:CheY-like chemotaxis protein
MNAIREDIDVQFSLADDLRPVKIDRIQMLQVIMNLVINARDAMPSGGRLILETYNREADADYVNTHPAILPGNYSVLAVTDTGTGMDAETQARIFEPFFTTKGVGQGTGMGLSTVYGIVKQSGGFIWVYSEVGKGTTFKIYLPWAEEASLPTPAKERSKPAKQATAVVLLVEDDAGLRRVISGFLAGAGYHVIEADSVPAAMAIAQDSSGQIDILLTDVILAGGNGRELADALREKGFNFHVVFMSGYTADAITHHGVLEPGIHFLQKPFTKTVLLDMMEKILA